MQAKTILTMAAAALCATAMAQAPAFPGAEGNGRYVTGGRGGKVVHVTNLNDTGTGSLRNAVKGNEKKTIVFDVGGVIPLASDLDIGANTTILGQTAPYPGITLRYYTVCPNGNNIIMRFIRIRRGQEKNVNDGADACWTHPQSGESSGATDATIVATHMMLEAASLDLGSVWISYFDQDKAREMLKLPDNWKPVCMLYIGYPADDFVPNTSLGGHRKPLSETCFYNELSERI